MLKLRYKKYAENFNRINKFQLMGDWSNSQKVLEPVLIEKIEKEGKTTARAVDIDADVKMSTDTDAEVIMDDTLMHLSNNSKDSLTNSFGCMCSFFLRFIWKQKLRLTLRVHVFVWKKKKLKQYVRTGKIYWWQFAQRPNYLCAQVTFSENSKSQYQNCCLLHCSQMPLRTRTYCIYECWILEGQSQTRFW